MSGFTNPTTSVSTFALQNPRGTGTQNLGASLDSAEATTGTQAITSSAVHFASVVLTAGTVVGTLNWATGATSSVGSTNAWLGLFDANLNLVAVTADFNTALLAAGANQIMNVAIANVAGGAATSYTVPSTGIYYVGFCVSGTTLPTTTHANVNAVITATAPRRSGRATGQATPPTFPYQLGTVTNVAYIPYLYATA